MSAEGATFGALRARARVFALVAFVALAAAAATVGATILQSRGSESQPVARPAPRAGSPSLFLELGLRTDEEARALRRAAGLYAEGRPREAARLLDPYSSLNARVASALAAWPNGTLPRLRRLSRSHPRRALVRLHVGLALFWLRRDGEAVAAWRAAGRVEPDSPSAVQAGNFLHTELAPNLPVFVSTFSVPRAVARLSPARRFAELARRARSGEVRPNLLYGVFLQRLGRPRSAERVYAAAAARAPRSIEAQVAAAVGRFRKNAPERAFSRLGPLSARFPRSQTVRFHLGLLLLWIGRADEGLRQLRQARALDRDSRLGVEAERFLARLGDRTERSAR